MRIQKQAEQHGLTRTAGTVRIDDPVWGYLLSVTDDNGKTHTHNCSQRAEGSLIREAELAGYDTIQDFVASWSDNPGYESTKITADSVLCTWLSDGTVTCFCDED